MSSNLIGSRGECGIMEKFGAPLSVKYYYNNFSFKVNYYLKNSYSIAYQFSFEKMVFLPLSRSSIVILPLLFQLCDFTPVILKRRSSLPLVWMFVI